jgi:glycosyltransferase involved in cell wall biosynthesis
VAIALLTTFLTDYRTPLFARLAERHGVEVLCYGGGERYVPAWFSDLDAQLQAAPFPARRLAGIGEALDIGRRYDAVIAPFAGGALLPAAYLGTRRHRRPFVLWASVWSQPRSVTHALALPATRHIYRHADAVLAYGEHVRRFVAGVRGSDSGIFVAPQSVEPELFGRQVGAQEIEAFRARHGLGSEPLVLFVGRLVPEKGAEVLLEAWPRVRSGATLVVAGDGPCAAPLRDAERVRVLGALRRAELPVAYAAALATVVPSIPTPRFREPWGLVCNEAMHQGRPVVASASVGAAAGGLVRDGQTGLVVPPGDPSALAGAVDRLIADEPLRSRLGAAARSAVAAYTYDAMVGAFDQALDRALHGRAGQVECDSPGSSTTTLEPVADSTSDLNA